MTERRKRFALILKDGTAVENLESLRENFDLQKIRQYFESGELLEWLKSWRYSDLVPKIETLVEFDPKLNKKLCNIFGVNYKQHAPIEEIEIRKEKLSMLKEITTESNILSRIDQVAFNTREVHDLLEDGLKEIFLFEGEYNFACGIFDETNVHYHGIGRVSIKIETNLKIDFSERGIEFENITVDGKFFPEAETKTAQPEIDHLSESDPIFREGKRAYDKKNYTQAFDLFMQAAELGNSDAMFFLALCYQNGNGTKMNIEKAVEWYKKSAELGNAKSMNNLGLCYQEGKGVNQGHLQAVIYFQKSAELGNAYAVKNLGDCYFYGRGIEQNYEKAVELYLKTVDNLDAESMNNLGECYYNGLGTKQTFKKAVQLFKKAVELGNSDAMNNLGIACRDGRGISPDKKKAAELFKKSAQLGNAKAKKNLSQL